MLLLDIRNDVWLRSEEYDPVAEHLPGNFPHVFSHVGLGTQPSIWAEVSFCLVLPLWQPSIRVENAALLLSEGQPILCLRDNEPVMCSWSKLTRFLGVFCLIVKA